MSNKKYLFLVGLQSAVVPMAIRMKKILKNREIDLPYETVIPSLTYTLRNQDHNTGIPVQQSSLLLYSQ